jgi:hypothetical protein
MGTSIQDWIENYVKGKERAPNDSGLPFKKKEKGGEGRFGLGGQWNVPSLVANGRFHAW